MNLNKNMKHYTLILILLILGFKAIGQKLVTEGLTDNSLELEKGRIVVDENRKTSLTKVWAGGDCILDGDNLTVSAVQDGKLAAISINETLTQGA